MNVQNPIQVKAGAREWIGLSVLVLACVLYAMDLTVLQLAIPKISEMLKPSSAQLLWIIDIYGFLVAASLITMGTLGDRIGRRRLLMVGAASFAIVSVVAAFSVNAEMLIASRAVMGVAGATLAPSTLSLIFNMFRDPGQRSTAIGVWISGFSAGGAIGPLVGGAMLEHFWWGSVFLLPLPIMAVLLVLGPRLLPEFQNAEAGKVDVKSAAMSLLAVLAVIYGVKQVAQDGIGFVAALAILGGLAVGLLFIRRQAGLADPLIDLALFRMPSFSVALLTNVMGVFIAVGYFLFIAQYLQLVIGLSPLEAGLWSLPSTAGFVVGSNVAPRFIHRFRPATVLGTALASAAIALALLTQVGGTYALVVMVLASVIISLALSPVFNLTTELIVGSAPPERAGVASGISETGSELGGALGIAILGSIGTAIYRSDLAANIPVNVPPEAQQAARDTLGGAVIVASQLPNPSGIQLLSAAREAFSHSLHVSAAIAAIVAIGAAILVAISLRNVSANPETGQDEELVMANGPTSHCCGAADL